MHRRPAARQPVVGAPGHRPEGVCRIVYNPGKSKVKVYVRRSVGPCWFRVTPVRGTGRDLETEKKIAKSKTYPPGGQEDELEDGVVGGVGLRQDLAYLYPGG